VGLWGCGGGAVNSALSSPPCGGSGWSVTTSRVKNAQSVVLQDRSPVGQAQEPGSTGDSGTPFVTQRFSGPSAVSTSGTEAMRCPPGQGAHVTELHRPKLRYDSSLYRLNMATQRRRTS
jgi:hypothetical protein